jgi:hypothetical protein
MSADIIIEDVTKQLAGRYGTARQEGRARIITFGTALTCSINYSKLLHGNKYFFGLPTAIIDPERGAPRTKFGAFILLICGSSERVLVLPRAFMIDMMKGVASRRVDVFLEDGCYILQTTQHPKRDVTEYLNAFPLEDRPPREGHTKEETNDKSSRIHLRIQFGLIMLGKAEGCSVWVPVNDRNLSYQRQPFSARTIGRLPNFGFEENTRRIVQNIDVLWLTKNVIQSAFEIESTTSIYSGLLRLNDLVLAQPNVQIELYIAAAKARRERVYSQLLRPSFQPLMPKCQFLAFEEIEKQVKQLENFPVESGARVSGLVRGERFSVTDHIPYPTGL